MDKKKKTWLIFPVVIGILFFIIKGFNIYTNVSAIIEEYSREKQWQDAQNRAISYIHDKYGIDAEVYKNYSRKKFEGNLSEADMETIQLDANGRMFFVHIDSKGRISDSYQTVEIESAIKEKLKNDFSCKTFSIMCYDINDITPDKGFVFIDIYLPGDTYFDGNLDNMEWSDKYIVEIEAMTSEPLNNSDLYEFLEKYNIDYNIVQLDNETQDIFMASETSDFDDLCHKYSDRITDHKVNMQHKNENSIY